MLRNFSLVLLFLLGTTLLAEGQGLGPGGAGGGGGGGMATNGSNAVLPDAPRNFSYARGMKCDGASDDTAALQAAINAAANAVLMLPSSATGTCHITAGSITITHAIVIQGQGMGGIIGGSSGVGTALEVTGGTGDVFSVQTKDAVEFRDLYLFFDTTPASGAVFALTGNAGGGHNNYNFGSVFEHLSLANGYDAIRVDEAGGITIRDNYVFGMLHDDLLVVNSLNADLGQHHIYGNYFWDQFQDAGGTEVNNPFATVNTSPTVTVTRTGHGLLSGQTVNYAPQAAFNNVTISGPYTVTVTDANHFTITASTNANATSSGGGASVKYTDSQHALIEYQSSLGTDIIGNNINGGAWGILVNQKYGPTGTMRVVGNSIENAGYQAIALTQGTSGAEGGNYQIIGNEFSESKAGAIGDLFVGTGTPTAQAKWIERLTFSGNAVNDNLANAGTSSVKISDGNIVNLSGNAMKNSVAGATGIAVLSGATHVVESGNTINFTSGSYGTMNAGSFDSLVVNGNSGTLQTFGTVIGGGRTVSGTTDTLAATDCGTTITYTSGSVVTVTTLANIVSAANTTCSIAIYQNGAGQVTIADGAGATHVSPHAYTKTAAQYATLSLFVGQGSPSQYVISGDGA